MRKNKNGFVLAETLVVSVIVMGIFSLIYANYYPLIGEYERREVYDDIDSKYVAHWIRKMIIEKNGNATTLKNLNSCNGQCHILYAAYYHDVTVGEDIVREKEELVDETDSVFGDNSSYIQNYIYAADVRAILITPYKITTLKNNFQANTTITTAAQQANINQYVFNRGFREYIQYLPQYKTASVNGANYRVIVIVDHDTSKEYDSYGTIEVKI